MYQALSDPVCIYFPPKAHQVTSHPIPIEEELGSGDLPSPTAKRWQSQGLNTVPCPVCVSVGL